MSSQHDQPPGSRGLPLAELNPLLNPLLAENMGRWAEVYFTNPPEKREQAVLALLQELGGRNSGTAGTSYPPSPQENATGKAVPAPDASSHVPAPELQGEEDLCTHPRCPSCGQENPRSHKFCGGCGTSLDEERPAIAQTYDSHPGNSTKQDFEYPTYEEQDSSPEPGWLARPSNNNGLSLFQQGSDARYDDDGILTYEPPSHHYRIYFGALLALLILGLGYMAWRGRQTAQTSHEPLPPPPAVNSEAPASSAVPSSSPAEAQPQKLPASTSNPSSAKAGDGENRTAKSIPDQEGSGTPVGAAERSKTSPAAPLADDGSQELALAQRYLNGASGQRRDTAEAARWLWKSIAKHNTHATVLLADLYLKGDGVSKNCDQARVLLDSAARKGISGAGERLRNLQAFGCQ